MDEMGERRLEGVDVLNVLLKWCNKVAGLMLKG